MMNFKTWFYALEDSNNGGVDSGLSRNQTLKPDKHFSDLAADVFLTKNSKKKKAYKVKHNREIQSFGLLK